MGIDDSLFGPVSRKQVLQMAVAEVIGTGMLIFLGCMGTVVGIVKGGHPHLLVAFAFGLTVMICIQVGVLTYQLLTLSNSIFLPTAYFPALIYFGRERGWWITCTRNYPTVLKEKNINRNRKSTTCAICSLKSVLHEEKRREQENHNVGQVPTLCFSSCSTDFSQQIMIFLFPTLFLM
jgi:hypothetical protein